MPVTDRHSATPGLHPGVCASTVARTLNQNMLLAGA
jgi:hypothetical protein